MVPHKQPASEILGRHTMSKGFNAIDKDHWNVMAIGMEQARITFNVYLIERIFVVTASSEHSYFSFITKMTAGPGV
ncbi:MAG TPA: hypothetical protein VNO50_20915 [Pyrinomonadaceae bacterium]|nr:hypothetical protein [Pyrinomonadaceae bacterium]